MARPPKKGLDFFSVDCGFFHCSELRPARGKFGGIYASGIYLYIICEIYENGYFLKFDDITFEDFILGAANSLNVKEGLVRQALDFFLKRSLFDNKLFETDKVLTSHAIQQRYQLATKARGAKKAIEVDDRYWLLEKTETESYIKVTHFESYSEKNPSYSEKNYSYSEEKHIKEIEKEIEIESIKREKEKKSLSAACANVLSLLENTVGTLSARACDEISSWLDECDVSVIEYAIEQAQTYNKRSFGYIRTIVNRCIKEKCTTRADCENTNKLQKDNSKYALDDMAAIERKKRLEKMRKGQGNDDNTTVAKR